MHFDLHLDLGYFHHTHLYLKDPKQLMSVLVIVCLRTLGVFGLRIICTMKGMKVRVIH